MGRHLVLSEVTSNYTGYFMVPNYTAPIHRDPSQSFWARLAAESGKATEEFPKKQVSSVEELSEEERLALRHWLEQDGGYVSEENWDNFLADLVDVGLITNQERLSITGPFIPLCPGSMEQVNRLWDTWEGDPVSWLTQVSRCFEKSLQWIRNGNDLGLDIPHVWKLADHKMSYDTIAQITQSILGR